MVNWCRGGALLNINLLHSNRILDGVYFYIFLLSLDLQSGNQMEHCAIILKSYEGSFEVMESFVQTGVVSE